MTVEQKEICVALGRVSYLPASFDKRFGNNLSSLAQHEPEKELSEKQNEWMYRLLYKYRKQVPNTYEKYKGNPLCSQKEGNVKAGEQAKSSLKNNNTSPLFQ